MVVIDCPPTKKQWSVIGITLAVVVATVLVVVFTLDASGGGSDDSWRNEGPTTGMAFSPEDDDILITETQRYLLGFEDAGNDDIQPPSSLPETESFLPPGMSEDDIQNDGEEPQELAMETGIELWPDAVLYYEIDPSLTLKARDDFSKAMAELEAKTCIRFKYSSTLSKRVLVKDGRGCSSYVGVVPDKYQPQPLKMNRNCGVRAGVHEILHALGFLHEQSRSDRDNHVLINWDNIPTDKVNNFRKASRLEHSTPYDYSSIMHYSRRAFARDISRDTITPISDQGQELGNDRLSNIDTQLLNQIYCGGGGSSDPCEPNPCASNQECVVDPQRSNGFFCRTTQTGGSLVVFTRNCNAWDIADLKFFSSADCAGTVAPLDYFVSGTVAAAGYESGNMFDSSQYSIWGGRPRSGSTTCYIAARFQSFPKCVKISHVNGWFASSLEVWTLDSSYQLQQRLIDPSYCPGTCQHRLAL